MTTFQGPPGAARFPAWGAEISALRGALAARLHTASQDQQTLGETGEEMDDGSHGCFECLLRLHRLECVL